MLPNRQSGPSRCARSLISLVRTNKRNMGCFPLKFSIYLGSLSLSLSFSFLSRVSRHVNSTNSTKSTASLRLRGIDREKPLTSSFRFVSYFVCVSLVRSCFAPCFFVDENREAPRNGESSILFCNRKKNVSRERLPSDAASFETVTSDDQSDIIISKLTAG